MTRRERFARGFVPTTTFVALGFEALVVAVLLSGIAEEALFGCAKDASALAQRPVTHFAWNLVSSHASHYLLLGLLLGLLPQLVGVYSGKRPVAIANARFFRATRATFLAGLSVSVLMGAGILTFDGGEPGHWWRVFFEPYELAGPPPPETWAWLAIPVPLIIFGGWVQRRTLGRLALVALGAAAPLLVAPYFFHRSLGLHYLCGGIAPDAYITIVGILKIGGLLLPLAVSILIEHRYEARSRAGTQADHPT